MAMAISPLIPNLPHPAPNQIDHLSNLPDALLITILSFLSTCIAARTSVLSRRFRHLWEASPSLDLDQKDFNHPIHEKFQPMADRALLRRNPSHPLLSFRLDYNTYASDSLFSSLLFKACSFSLRHLTIGSCYFSDIKPFLPVIFSIKSLQSLSLSDIAPSPALIWPKYKKDDYVLPSATSLTCLTTLSIQRYAFHPNHTTALNQLLSQLPSLQELQLGLCQVNGFDISSHTIRKLKLVILCRLVPLGLVPIDNFRLSLPLLESLHLENDGHILQFPTIHGEFPLLKKVVLNFNDLRKKDVFAVNGLLHYVSHVEELIMHIKESELYVIPTV